jgi:hypothetical protein
MSQEMTLAISALGIAYLLGGVIKRVIDRAMPPPYIERQIEILKSIDERLEKMNGAVATTLGIVQHNGEGIKELKRCFVPHAQMTSEGVPRWWCHWPRVKGELMGILEEIRGLLKKKEA